MNKISRLRGALERLESQQKRGSKTEKGISIKKVPMTDKDKKRIEKEIEAVKIHLNRKNSGLV